MDTRFLHANVDARVTDKRSVIIQISMCVLYVT